MRVKVIGAERGRKVHRVRGEGISGMFGRDRMGSAQGPIERGIRSVVNSIGLVVALRDSLLGCCLSSYRGWVGGSVKRGVGSPVEVVGLGSPRKRGAESLSASIRTGVLGESGVGGDAIGDQALLIVGVAVVIPKPGVGHIRLAARMEIFMLKPIVVDRPLLLRLHPVRVWVAPAHGHFAKVDGQRTQLRGTGPIAPLVAIRSTLHGEGRPRRNILAVRMQRGGWSQMRVRRVRPFLTPTQRELRVVACRRDAPTS